VGPSLLASSGIYVAIAIAVVTFGSTAKKVARLAAVDVKFVEKIVSPPPPPAPAPVVDVKPQAPAAMAPVVRPEQKVLGAVSQPNDLDYALLESIVKATALTPGRLFTIQLEDCACAAAPTAGDFACTVTDASDPDGVTVDGVTCAVTVP
jgi:hypothetical protein